MAEPPKTGLVVSLVLLPSLRFAANFDRKYRGVPKQAVGYTNARSDTVLSHRLSFGFLSKKMIAALIITKSNGLGPKNCCS